MWELNTHPVTQFLARVQRIPTVEMRDKDSAGGNLFLGTTPSTEAEAQAKRDTRQIHTGRESSGTTTWLDRQGRRQQALEGQSDGLGETIAQKEGLGNWNGWVTADG